jgi:hypothetical protein
LLETSVSWLPELEFDKLKSRVHRSFV